MMSRKTTPDMKTSNSGRRGASRGQRIEADVRHRAIIKTAPTTPGKHAIVVIVNSPSSAAGGFRVPLVYRAAPTLAQRITTVCLYDVDPSAWRASRMSLRAIAEQSDRTAWRSATIEVTDSIDVALDGADFVFSAIRVGGPAAGRRRAGGYRARPDRPGNDRQAGRDAYGLRTIPVASTWPAASGARPERVGGQLHPTPPG